MQTRAPCVCRRQCIAGDSSDAKSSKYLQIGDILVTKTKGHTVIVLTNGSEVKSDPEPEPTPEPEPVKTYEFTVETVKDGSRGSSTLLCQKILFADGYKGGNGKDLALDGICGANTIYAINSFQTDMRSKGIECGSNGKNDGICGSKCWKYLLGR